MTISDTLAEYAAEFTPEQYPTVYGVHVNSDTEPEAIDAALEFANTYGDAAPIEIGTSPVWRQIYFDSGEVERAISEILQGNETVHLSGTWLPRDPYPGCEGDMGFVLYRRHRYPGQTEGPWVLEWEAENGSCPDMEE